MKLENNDAALELQNEMLGKMPWMRLALPSLSINITDEAGNLILSEFTEPSLLKYVWEVSPLDRLSIAEQTRRVWFAVRHLRSQLNEHVGDFVKAATKRDQLTVYVRYNLILLL